MGQQIQTGRVAGRVGANPDLVFVAPVSARHNIGVIDYTKEFREQHSGSLLKA
jgi:hypothetical protein